MKTYASQVQFTVEAPSSEDKLKYMYNKIYIKFKWFPIYSAPALY